MLNRSAKYYFYCILGAVLIGTVGIWIKLIGDSIHPMIVGFYRLFFACVTLAIVTPLIDKKALKIEKKNLGMYAIVGALIAISYTLTNVAFLLSPVSKVALLYILTPFSAVTFAALFLKEKLDSTKITALIIAMFALAFMSPFGDGNPWGYFIRLIVVLLDGIIITFMRRFAIENTIANVPWFFFFATLFMSPFLFFYAAAPPSVPVLLLGIVATGFGYLFLNLGLQKIEAGVGSILLVIVLPITAIILATIVLGEVVTFQMALVGMQLAVAAIYLIYQRFATPERV